MTRPTGFCSAHRYGEDSTCTTCWPAWAWASLPGLTYRDGTTRIEIAMFDVNNWRGRVHRITSERTQEMR